MTKRKLPTIASVTMGGEGGKLIAPAASRNSSVLCDLLDRVAPYSGNALELASGTGQHVMAFAHRLSELFWQPSEISPERRASIRAYTKDIPNVAPPIHLDAITPGWHSDLKQQNLIVLINLLHLISQNEMETLIGEAALALKVGGRLVLYGPFKREGHLTSDGDQRFHDALVLQDPEIGYKNDTEMLVLLRDTGLHVLEVAEMPTNNLAFIVKKPVT